MKNITKLVLALSVGIVLRGAASAAALEDLQVKELAKFSVSMYKAYNDGKSLNIKYTGSAATADVSITSAVVTLAAPTGTTLHTIDTTYAAYDTMSELCSYISSLSGFSCSMVGAKGDDASILLYDPVTNASIKGAAGYDVAFGTGAVYGETGVYINRIGITPQSNKRVVLKYCNVQNDGTGTIDIYGKLMKYATGNDGVTRNDTTKVASMATANDTSETDGNIYGGNWLEFAPNEHVVVSAGNATTTQTSTSFLECYWDEK